MEQWKMICKLKDIPLQGARVVPRGLAWQELPGVALVRHGENQVEARLERDRASSDEAAARSYAVKVEDGRVYLDMDELGAPASRAEAALAGAFAVAPHIAPA
ncbi:MAG TPA: hypothetical protein DCW29_21645 [Janthinobacterium sp.]|nr:hypothetical protein [Janthinobacterium sp.]